MFGVIHHNRWFFWTITIILGIGLFVISAIKRAEVQFIDDAVVIDQPYWHAWQSDEFGMQLRYPAGWQIEIDRDDIHSIYFENPQNNNENVATSVRSPSMEAAIRLTLENFTEEEVVVDGEIGRWLKGQNAADNIRHNVILVQHDGKLFYISGSARSFKQIVHSIRFIN